MTAWAYYNEFDPHAAAWLRNLITMGLIAPGEVDERDIREVQPDDLRGFTQCHFFAGIGVWSYSLRRAGWSDSRPVWTGSCPCQGFSAAGQQRGFNDERHLWPDWYRLIKEGKPPVIFGEQVQSALIVGKARNKTSEFGPYGLYDPDRDAQIPTAWFDLICADLEEAIYAVGVRDTPAAGSGAPHIRQRLFFVAKRMEHSQSDGRLEWRPEPSRGSIVSGCGAVGLVDGERSGLEGLAGHDGSDRRRQGEAGSVAASSFVGRVADGNIDRCDERITRDARSEEGSRSEHGNVDDRRGASGSVADAECFERQRGKSGEEGVQQGALERTERLRDAERMAYDGGERRQQIARGAFGDEEENGRTRRIGSRADSDNIATGYGENDWSGPVNGFWRNVDWLFCRDGKWRPVESGTFPLVDGAAFRLGSGSPFEGKSRQEILKGVGNAIVFPVAVSFIEDFLEATGQIIDSDDEIVVRAESLLK
ncbi:DNA cytosine methyltransferase [Ochrobactrum sp. WV_118_8]